LDKVAEEQLQPLRIRPRLLQPRPSEDILAQSLRRS